MASNEMDAAKLQDELKDITECCICAETYEDPRILPCIHTFCKKCLDDTGSKFGKKPGEWMPCPLCRRQFTIPFAGFSGIQKNFFMARLIEMTKSSSIPSCALCNTSSVEMYCKECCVNLCNNCCKSHRTNKLTKNHEVVIIENQKTPRQTQDNLASDICQKHDKERLKIYCFDCKTIVCAFCYIESHQSHNWSDVNKAAETFRNQIQYSIWNLALRNKGLQEKKEELSQAKLNILTSVKSLELKVNQRKAFLKGIIDKHAGLLLADLEAMHQEKLKLIELQEDEIDMLMTDQDSYSFYCQKITTDKSDGDVCRADAELGKRSAQLQEMNDSICQHHIQPFNVSFKISKLDQFLKKNGTNFVGKIEGNKNLQAADAESVTELEKKNESGPVKTVVTGAKSKRQDKKKGNLVAKATADQEGKKTKDSLSPQANTKPPKTKNAAEMQKGKALFDVTLPIQRITGLAIIENEIFIITKSSTTIAVFNSSNLSFKRQLLVPELISPEDIVASLNPKCLYVFDATADGKIYQVNTDGSAIASWITGSLEVRLTITPECNVVVTYLEKNKLKEYKSTADRRLVQQVVLPSKSRCAVKLKTGNFMVSRGEDTDEEDSPDDVLEVDASGKEISSFKGEEGSEFTWLNCPERLAVDKNGSVIVVDRGNRRILLLNSNLEFQKVLLSSKNGLQDPIAMVLDDATSRLFVADYDIALDSWKMFVVNVRRA